MLRALLVLQLCVGALECDDDTEAQVEPERPAEPEHPPVEALEALPRLEPTQEHVPGASSYPSLFVELDEPIAGAQAKAAYEATFDEFGGLEGWLIQALTESGWQRLPDGPADDQPIRRLSCGIDLLANPTRTARSVMLNIRTIRRACPWLARHARGDSVGVLDQSAVLARSDAIRETAQRHGTLRVTLDAATPFGLNDVQRLARELGFQRADMGSYAWPGEEKLIILTADNDAPLDIGFRDDEEIEVEAIVVKTNLSTAPVPDLVASRLLSVVRAYRQVLGARAKVGGERLSDDALTSRVEAAVSELKEVGFGNAFRQAR